MVEDPIILGHLVLIGQNCQVHTTDETTSQTLWNDMKIGYIGCDVDNYEHHCPDPKAIQQLQVSMIRSTLPLMLASLEATNCFIHSNFIWQPAYIWHLVVAWIEQDNDSKINMSYNYMPTPPSKIVK